MTDLLARAPKEGQESPRPAPATPSRLTWARLALVAGWALVVAPFVLEAVAILRASEQWLVQRTPDDAFYYLEIARRIDHGQGFTFDGINSTNGFHPLWQMMLAGLGLVVPGSTAFIKASLLMCLLCLFGAVLLLIRLVWRWLGPGPALLGAIIAIHGRYTMTNLVDGMEGALAVLALALLATVLVRYFESPSTKWAVAVGAVSTLVLLARLDTAVVIWMVPLVMVWRQRSWRPAGSWTLGALLGAPWAIWFWFRFHHVLTTSAMVKQHAVSAFAHQHYGGMVSLGYLHFVADTGGAYLRSLTELVDDSVLQGSGLAFTVAAVIIFALAVAGAVIVVTRIRRGDVDGIGASTDKVTVTATAWVAGTLLVMLAGKALFDLFNAPMWAAGWYSTPQRVGFGFVVGASAWVGATALWRVRPGLGVAAIAGLALFALPLNGTQTINSSVRPPDALSWQEQINAAVGWVQQHGPAGRYGARDAGLLGYRLDGVHPVVNLDGLVNNYRYAQIIEKDGSLRRQVAATGVDIVVNRLSTVELHQTSCGKVLWTSPASVDVIDPATGQRTTASVYVLDVRGCRQL